MYLAQYQIAIFVVFKEIIVGTPRACTYFSDVAQMSIRACGSSPSHEP